MLSTPLMATPSSSKPVVLFLCTANACRSQMAEALARRALGEQADVFSAGVRPGERVDPRALLALAELGVALPGARNKSIAEAEALFAGRKPALVVTVCGNADEEPCPIYGRAARKVHRGFRDPPHLARDAGAAATDAAALPFYREVRDEIEAMLRAELEGLLPGVTLLPLPAAPAEAAADAPKAAASALDAAGASAESKGSAGVVTASPAPAAASSPLDFFASYLTVWVALCMIGGGLIGAYVPAAPAALEHATVAGVNGIIAALLWVMLFPMFVTLEWSALRRVADAPSSVILTAILSYAVKPFTMFGLGIFFTRVAFARHMPDAALRDSYVAGLVLLAGAPCTAMVFVWSALMNGSTANTLLMVGVNDLLMLALYVPICGLLIGTTSIGLPWDTIAASVAFFVLGPLLLAAGVRWAVLRSHDEKFLNERVVAPTKPLTTVALLATLVIIFVFQGARIRDNVADVFLLAVPILIQCVLLWALCYGVSFAMCIPHERAGPASLIATSNFFELAVAVAVAIYGPGSGAALATVVGVLVEVPIMLLFTKVVNALKPRLDARCAACDETCAAYRFKGDRTAAPALPMSLADVAAPMNPLAAAAPPAPAACCTAGKPCK